MRVITVKSQKGISFLNFILFLSVFGLLAVTAMKMAPSYLEFNSIKQAVEAVASESGSKNLSNSEIRKRLDKRFNVNYVNSIKGRDVRIVKTGSRKDLLVNYEVRKPLFYNVSVIMLFQHSAEMK